MSLGTVLLLKIFPALLPPTDEEDRDFYEVLGLESKRATEQEIRKAYKQKSLSLHPDKVAQRRESSFTAEEAAKEYQLVQEAHACLSDKASRQKYHAVKCSPTRYRFLTQNGGLGNQMALLQNLSHASFADKTKLVLFVSIFPSVLMIQPILIAVKVNHILEQNGALEDASWVALLTPWWIFHGLFVAFWIMLSFMAPTEAKLPIVVTALQQLLWLIGLILLALRWDHTITSNYGVVFIPIYLALVLKWIHLVLVMQQIKRDMSKMVSKHHFLEVVLHGREPDELEDEELKDLQSKYVVVHQIPADVEHDLEHDEDDKKLSEEEKEEIRVSSSREFESALEVLGSTRWDLVRSMIFDVTFLILLILKVDNHSDMSWWIVFIPILALYGLRFLRNCFTCCCAPTPMDPDDVVVMAALHKAEQDKNNDKEADVEAGDEGEKKNENDAGEPTPSENAMSYPLNTKVLLHDLKAEEYNGKTGIVKGPLKDGRQQVYIEQLDKTVALKVSNLTEVTIGANATGLNKAKADGEHTTKSIQKSESSSSQTNAERPSPVTKDSQDPGETDGNANTNAPMKESGEAKGDDDDDSHISIHIDEETYKAYHSAYADAEANAMEERLRAGQGNCLIALQLIMVCLLIAKLEQAYEATDQRATEGDDAEVDVGFNTLWLLFPLFLIVGLMLCCCACLIYNAPDPEELMNQNAEGKEGDEENKEDTGEDDKVDGDTPVVVTPPPPASVDATSAPNNDDEAKNEGNEIVQPPDVEADINDLD